MCQYIEIPTHRYIKKAIRFMPWGKTVWYYNKEKKCISTGKLIGFKTTIYESDRKVIGSWAVFDFESAGKDIINVPAGEMFLSERQALSWAMQNTNIQKV